MHIHITETTNIDASLMEDEALFFPRKKKSTRSRKWREIEEFKARQRLTKELQEIDQSFVYTLSDLT